MAKKDNKKQKKKVAQRQPVDGDPEQKKGGGVKPLLIMFLILDLLAGGFYAYLALVKNPGAKKELRRTEHNLQEFYGNVINVVAQADRIQSEQIERVSDPGRIIQERAAARKILDKIRVNSPISTRLQKFPKYQEISVNVNFGKKEGYQFADLIGFLESIDKSNRKVQIKAINFGDRDRDLEGGNNTWRPNSMDVRTFTLQGT